MRVGGVVGIEIEHRSVGEAGFDDESDVVGVDRPSRRGFRCVLVEEVSVKLCCFHGFVEMEPNFGEDEGICDWEFGPFWVRISLEDIPTDAEGVADEVKFTLAMPDEFFTTKSAYEGPGFFEVVSLKFEDRGLALTGVDEELEGVGSEF